MENDGWVPQDHFQPALYGSVVIIAYGDVITGLGVKNGIYAWSQLLGGTVSSQSSVVVYGGHAYVGTQHALYAVQTNIAGQQEGRPIEAQRIVWSKTHTKSGAPVSPTAHPQVASVSKTPEGLIILTTNYGTRAFDAFTGAERWWTDDLALSSSRQITYSSGAIFAEGSSTYINGVRSNGGTKAISVKTGKVMETYPLVATSNAPVLVSAEQKDMCFVSETAISYHASFSCYKRMPLTGDSTLAPGMQGGAPAATLPPGSTNPPDFAGYVTPAPGTPDLGCLVSTETALNGFVNCVKKNILDQFPVGKPTASWPNCTVSVYEQLLACTAAYRLLIKESNLERAKYCLQSGAYLQSAVSQLNSSAPFQNFCGDASKFCGVDGSTQPGASMACNFLTTPLYPGEVLPALFPLINQTYTTTPDFSFSYPPGWVEATTVPPTPAPTPLPPGHTHAPPTPVPETPVPPTPVPETPVPPTPLPPGHTHAPPTPMPPTPVPGTPAPTTGVPPTPAPVTTTTAAPPTPAPTQGVESRTFTATLAKGQTIGDLKDKLAKMFPGVTTRIFYTSSDKDNREEVSFLFIGTTAANAEGDAASLEKRKNELSSIVDVSTLTSAAATNSPTAPIKEKSNTPLIIGVVITVALVIILIVVIVSKFACGKKTHAESDYYIGQDHNLNEELVSHQPESRVDV